MTPYYDPQKLYRKCYNCKSRAHKYTQAARYPVPISETSPHVAQSGRIGRGRGQAWRRRFLSKKKPQAPKLRDLDIRSQR